MPSTDQTAAEIKALDRSPLPASLLAAFGLALAVTPDRWTALVGLTIGLPMAALSLGRPSIRIGLRNPHLIAVIGPLLFGFMWLGGPRAEPFPEPNWVHLAGGAVWLACTAIVITRHGHLGKRLRQGIVSVVLVATAILGVALLNEARDVGLDVAHFHVAAAEALTAGESPYSEAVTIPDGSPLADADDVFVGYPYPPATLFPFALSEILLDEPRAVSLGAWLVFLLILARPAIREEKPSNSITAFLLAASIPGWPLILLAGWTETVTLVLLAGAFLLWRRFGALSAAALGLGMASKQYLAVIWPMTLRWRVASRWLRVVIVTVSAVVALSPLLLWDFGEVYHSLVEIHVTRPPRADGTSLVGYLDLAGIAWTPPAWLSLLLPVVAAIALGPLIHDRGSYAVVSALVLATTFLFSSQAFTNYWLLPAGLIFLVAAYPRGEGHRE